MKDCGAIDPVNFGNRSRKRLLGKSRRADGEGPSTSQNDLCDFHGSFPVAGILKGLHCVFRRNSARKTVTTSRPSLSVT